MGQDSIGWLDQLSQRRSLSRWAKVVRAVKGMELTDLREQRQQARALRQTLDEVVHVADSRLALPRIGSASFPRPPGTRWAWRPQMWRGPVKPYGFAAVENKAKIGSEIKVFHDCGHSEMTIRQVRNTREKDLAPFGLRMDVLGFSGSFLSVVIDLPSDAADGLRRRDIIRVQTLLSVENPIEIFVRLNIKHGPNTEQLVQELPLNDPDVVVDFDLNYSDFNENRIDSMWIDLIFEDPIMNQIYLRDLTICRYPRAEM